MKQETNVIQLKATNHHTAVTVLVLALERFIDDQYQHCEWSNAFYGIQSELARYERLKLDEARDMLSQLCPEAAQ